MTQKEIVTKFAEAAEMFPTIVGQTTNAQLNKMQEVLFQLLIDIPYDRTAGIDNLVGIITLRADYMVEYGQAFVLPAQVEA